MKPNDHKRVKLLALSFASVCTLSLFYSNCSNSGFQASNMSSLSSSDPVGISLALRDLDASNSSSVSFSYDLTGQNLSSVRTQCYLNSTQQADCASPIDMSAMPDADYTLTVKAVNQNSLVLAQAQKVFRFDRKAPVLTINSAPSGTITTSSASIAFSVTDNFPGAVAYCSLDSAAFAQCTSPLNLSNLAQGAHSVRIYAQDAKLNKSATQTVSFSVNLVVAAPTITLSEMPAAFSNSASASFGFSGSSSSSTIAGYECSLDNAAFTACSSPSSYSSLAEGSHSFSVRAKDALGQTSSAANYNFAIDMTKPSTPSVNSSSISPSKSTSLSLTFNSTDSSGIAKYECKLDAGSFAACVSPQAYSGLSSANHTFAVRATDKAGNVSAEGSYSILIDTVAPVVAITSQPASVTGATSASFSFTVSDSGSGVNLIECQLDAQAYASCVSPQAYNNLAVGSHTFNIRGSDKAGNSAVQSYTWNIPVTDPTPSPSPSSSPSSPMNLVAAGVSHVTGEVSLAWVPVSGAARYKIFRDGTQIATTITPDYLDVGLKALTSFSYQVSAFDSKGVQLMQSNSATGTTLAYNPTTCAPAPTSTLVVNVKNTGAKGDGVTDDTAAIQAAINQVLGTGGTVLVPDGTYMINAKYQQGASIGLFIPYPGKLTFKMSSGAVLKTIGNAETGAYFTLRTNMAPDVNIIGGTIVGDRDSHIGTPSEYGMNLGIYGGSNIYVENVVSRDAVGDNFYLGTNNPTKVTFCSAVALNARRQNMSLITANGVTITNSVFANTNGPYTCAGIDIEPDDQDTVNDVKITNSQFIHNTGVGFGATIAPSYTNIFIQNIVFENNLVAYNSSMGGTSGWQTSIQIDNTKGPVRIANNTIRGGLNDGISLTNGTQNTTITGNSIQNNLLYGVYMISGSTANFITNNTICGNRSAQFQDSVGGNTNTGNTMSAVCP